MDRAYRSLLMKNLPVWSSGYDPWDLGLQTHQVPVEPLLDKIGIPYDPEKKYLGKNGEYIGKPAIAENLKFCH